MKTLHLERMFNNEEGIFYGYVDNSATALIFYQKDVAELVLAGFEVTYNSDDQDVVETLECTTIKYIEVDTNADGSGEHDVYEHNAYLNKGEIKMNYEGKHIKTYKQEKSAIKFAKKLGYEVVIN